MDQTENLLVTTIDTADKEGIIDTVEKKGKSKQIVVEEAITSPFSAKNNIDKINKTEKSQTLKKQYLPPKEINPTLLTQ